MQKNYRNLSDLPNSVELRGAPAADGEEGHATPTGAGEEDGNSMLGWDGLGYPGHGNRLTHSPNAAAAGDIS